MSSCQSCVPRKKSCCVEEEIQQCCKPKPKLPPKLRYVPSEYVTCESEEPPPPPMPLECPDLCPGKCERRGQIGTPLRELVEQEACANPCSPMDLIQESPWNEVSELTSCKKECPEEAPVIGQQLEDLLVEELQNRDLYEAPCPAKPKKCSCARLKLKERRTPSCIQQDSRVSCSTLRRQEKMRRKKKKRKVLHCAEGVPEVAENQFDYS